MLIWKKDCSHNGKILEWIKYKDCQFDWAIGLCEVGRYDAHDNEGGMIVQKKSHFKVSQL